MLGSIEGGRGADFALLGVQTGLSLRVRLLRSLPERFKVDIKVKEGTHQSENAGEAATFSLVSAPGSALTLAPL